MDIDTNTAISFCAFLVAFASLLGNSRKDAAKNEANMSELKTSIEFIKDKLNDMDKRFVRYERDVQDAKEIAIYARERAESAHKRLDRAGIDMNTSD